MLLLFEDASNSHSSGQLEKVHLPARRPFFLGIWNISANALELYLPDTCHFSDHEKGKGEEKYN